MQVRRCTLLVRNARRMDKKDLRNPGGFVISLDFELHWGIRDHCTVDQYRENLLGVRQAIPAMLQLFERYGIHATWATVGFLFFENIDYLKASVPNELPHYQQPNLDPYAALPEVGRNEDEDPFHFAPTLIRKILASEGQEVATHTLSHFYASAPGPSLESFRADLRGAKLAARQYDIALRSIVFPRNQISRQHIRICAEEGLIAYRSMEADPLIETGNGSIGRALRLADAYFKINGDGCVTPSLDIEYNIVRVSQSRFLRPWSAAFKAFEAMRMRRICESMSKAANRSKTFHLWWHPHNFGSHLDENMTVLTRIVEHYAHLKRELGWTSLTMAEVAENVLRTEKPHCVA
jgi:peptidoglycan/xylan/chitin deacetylase (PgdA/CDA1 family)